MLTPFRSSHRNTHPFRRISIYATNARAPKGGAAFSPGWSAAKSWVGVTTRARVPSGTTGFVPTRHAFRDANSRSLRSGRDDKKQFVLPRESQKARPKPGSITTTTVYVPRGGIVGGIGAVVDGACGVTGFPQYGHTT